MQLQKQPSKRELLRRVVSVAVGFRSLGIGSKSSCGVATVEQASCFFTRPFDLQMRIYDARLEVPYHRRVVELVTYPESIFFELRSSPSGRICL
jgi:hypothetical protein